MIVQREGDLCTATRTAHLQSKLSGKHGCTITTIISGSMGSSPRTNGAKCAVIPYGTVEYNNLNKYPGMIEKIRQAKYEVLYCKLNKDMDEVVIDNIEDAAYIKVVF